MFLTTIFLCAGTLSFVCWMCVLFLGFCCHLWILVECGGCEFPFMQCFWDPTRCGQWGFHVECVSWYWELPFMNWDRLETWRAEGVHSKRRAGHTTKIFLVFWEWGQRARRGHNRSSDTELRMRLGDWRRGSESGYFQYESQANITCRVQGNTQRTWQLRQRDDVQKMAVGKYYH